ncbi:MAG: tRNA epoxyqueuosine(34) reductase QueG [Fibrobacterota bacterium]
MTQTHEDLKDIIGGYARELGFSACGFAAVRSLDEYRDHLQAWLDEGCHASMKWMENYFEKRIDPQKMVPEAQTAIVLLLNYYPAVPLSTAGPTVAKYAYGKDYHEVMKNKLFALKDKISAHNDISGRAFVDSAPVLERPWAVEAGLGWIGKNSLLISPVYGSYCFIGELFLSLKLEPDLPFEKEYCGSCTRCIDACPGGAIGHDRRVDSRRCVSYQTIEHRGEFDRPIQLTESLFGCDICQDVCPWNKKAIPTTCDDFAPSEELSTLFRNKRWQNMAREEFNRIFSNSVVKRTKYEGFMRNVRAFHSL